MREGVNTGWIEVICGSMFSGKSEELIRRVHRVLNQLLIIGMLFSIFTHITVLRLTQ